VRQDDPSAASTPRTFVLVELVIVTCVSVPWAMDSDTGFAGLITAPLAAGTVLMTAGSTRDEGRLPVPVGRAVGAEPVKPPWPGLPLDA
jgi:hypothetical protein